MNTYKKKLFWSAILMFCLLATFCVMLSVFRNASAQSPTTITVSVEGYNQALPVLVAGEDFSIGQAVKTDPRFFLDEHGNAPLAQLIEEKEQMGLSLIWHDEAGIVFDWFSTPVTSSKTVTGSFVEDLYQIRIVFNDDAETPDICTSVAKGNSFSSAYGSSLPTPIKDGYSFKGWIDSSTELEFNPDSPIYASTVVVASYETKKNSSVNLSNPAQDIPKTLSGSCYIGKTWGVHPAKFSLSGFTGGLKGVAGTGVCSLASAAAPSFTTASYKASLKSVNTKKGTIVYDVTITPPGVASPDGPRNKLGLIGYQTISFKATIKRNFGGYIDIEKTSSNPSITAGNQAYSLAGAIFGVYNSENKRVCELVTDESGNTPTSPLLPAGTYTVKEEQNPQSYAGNAEKEVVVSAGETTKSSFTNAPQNNPVDLVLTKKDGELGESTALGSGTLEGAQYQFLYYDGFYENEAEAKNSGSPTRTWTFATDVSAEIHFTKDYLIEGDEFYYNEAGNITLPLGTLVIKETKAPRGYKLSDETICIPISPEGNEEILDTFQEAIHSDFIKRGDIAFSKTNGHTMERLSAVPFTITSLTTGETHTVITDNNGLINTHASWNPHTLNTNIGLSCYDGIWFGETTSGLKASPNDNLGALPYDTYLIQEQPCDANEGLDLIEFEITIDRDMTNLDLGTVDNNPLKEPKIDPEPETEKEPKQSAPKTGDIPGLIPLLLLCITLSVFFILYTRRKQKQPSKAQFYIDYWNN